MKNIRIILVCLGISATTQIIPASSFASDGAPEAEASTSPILWQTYFTAAKSALERGQTAESELLLQSAIRQFPTISATNSNCKETMRLLSDIYAKQGRQILADYYAQAAASQRTFNMTDIDSTARGEKEITADQKISEGKTQEACQLLIDGCKNADAATKLKLRIKLAKLQMKDTATARRTLFEALSDYDAATPQEKSTPSVVLLLADGLLALGELETAEHKTLESKALLERALDLRGKVSGAISPGSTVIRDKLREIDKSQVFQAPPPPLVRTQSSAEASRKIIEPLPVASPGAFAVVPQLRPIDAPTVASKEDHRIGAPAPRKAAYGGGGGAQSGGPEIVVRPNDSNVKRNLAASTNPSYLEYLDLIGKLVRQHWFYAESVPGATKAVINYQVHRSGAVSKIKIEKTSGNSNYDEAALAAVGAAAPLPPIPDAIASGTSIIEVSSEFYP